MEQTAAAATPILDQQFAERERELIKLNAKVNAKTKKVQANAAAKIQVHTTNNNLNFYDSKSDDDDTVELLKCKKIQLECAPPTKKFHEVNYPLFSRKIVRTNLDIHLPTSSLMPDGNAEPVVDDKSIIESESTPQGAADGKSLHSESMRTRFSGDSSPIPPAQPVESMPRVAEDRVAEVIPKAFDKKNVSNEGLLKFLKSKVALLQTELEAGKNLNDTLERENSKLQKRMKKLTIQDEKSKSRIESLETSLKALNDRQEINENDLRDKDTMMTELNQELRSLREEAKETNHHKQVLEKQVLKLQEDFEYLTSKYETLKDAEMVMRDTSRLDRIAGEEKIRKLRKSRMDLLKAYKQQIILIDNLKRQNVCLEKAKMLEIAEKEFLKILDWNFIEK